MRKIKADVIYSYGKYKYKCTFSGSNGPIQTGPVIEF